MSTLATNGMLFKFNCPLEQLYYDFDNNNWFLQTKKGEKTIPFLDLTKKKSYQQNPDGRVLKKRYNI